MESHCPSPITQSTSPNISSGAPMEHSHFDLPFGFWPIGFVKYPSSFDVLPPPKFPFVQQVATVDRLKIALVRNSGISIGTYHAWDRKLYPAVKGVYDGLMTRLSEELSRVNTFKLCCRLYERHEEYIGYILMGHHEAASLRRIGRSHASPMANQMRWERL